MNLLQEIYDRLLFEQLIAEGKDPREVLHYKYKNVPSEIIDKVIEIDPTKKKSYSQWLLSKWDDESDTILTNLKNGRIAKLFQYYKANQDIQIKDCPSVEVGLRDYIPEEDTVLTKSSEPKTYVKNLDEEVPSELANDFDIVYDDGSWLIAVPNTYEAECKLGENMQWCTANGFGHGGESYYNQYMSKGGDLYVNFDMTEGERARGKDYPYTRYQFHFESNQFMDMNDDPVSLDEIGMPDGALDFYKEKGYDESYFMNEEERWENYENRRWEDAYQINDELYLNTEYNDEYQYEEPTENTTFYLFDENDSRDPITFDGIANPNYNEVVLVNEEEVVILQLECGTMLFLQREENNYGRDWAYVEIMKYIELNDGFFTLDIDKTCSYHSLGGETFRVEDVQIKDCAAIFLNEPCSRLDEWDRSFIELIDKEGYHSLFAIGENGMDCIVTRDMPMNEKCFLINDRGLVEGEFRTYRVYDDEDYEEDENYISYNFEKVLSNGNYLVSQMFRNEAYQNKKKLFNIMERGAREVLLDDWFENILRLDNDTYVTQNTDGVGFYTRDGQRVGELYNAYGITDEEKSVYGGILRLSRSEERVDIINLLQGRIVASVAKMITYKGHNNKVIVQDFDGSTKCLDYMTGEICFQELKDFRYSKAFYNSYNDHIIFCQYQNGENAILDLNSLKVAASGFTSVERADSYDYDHIILRKKNGKENIFGMKEGKELLPYDVDMVTSFCSQPYITVYKLNGRYYPYCYKLGGMPIMNPNGFDIPVRVTSSGQLMFGENKCVISFVYEKKDEGGFKWWPYLWQLDRNYSYEFDENMPQEIVELYSRITGQFTDVTEGFKRMMNRINEAMKLTRMDYVD